MKYLIFSDESGTWNGGKYYVRSWIKITPDNYELLRKEVIFSKHEVGVKELKWQNFKKNYQKFKSIFSCDFDIFITISKPDHLNAKNYRIISIINGVPTSTGGEKLTDKIKKKIINSTKNQLFLNYFEKIHIMNSVCALLNGENPDEYKYIIDTPQYLDREWEEVARECEITQLDIVKESANIPGIEIADIVSGVIMTLLERKNDNNIYEECIKPKMINMKSRSFPNPNLIFYDDFTPKEKSEINIFR